jgi:hypothetical protein
MFISIVLRDDKGEVQIENVSKIILQQDRNAPRQEFEVADTENFILLNNRYYSFVGSSTAVLNSADILYLNFVKED